MAPSTVLAADTCTKLQGTIRSYDRRTCSGVIVGEDHAQYFFHLIAVRFDSGASGFSTAKPARAPRIGDKVTFMPGAQRAPGQVRTAAPWAFVEQTPAAPAAPPVLRLSQLIDQKIDGLAGLVIAFETLHTSLTPTEIRAFCSVSLSGEELWNDFKRVMRESSDRSTYDFVRYARAILARAHDAV